MRDYAWLVEALRPYCDEIELSAADYDRSQRIAVRWRQPGKPDKYLGFLVERAYRSDRGEKQEHLSLQLDIAEGRFTEREAIERVLRRAPAEWVPPSPGWLAPVHDGWALRPARSQ